MIAAAAAIAGVVAFLARDRPLQPPIPGMVRQTEIRIAPEIDRAAGDDRGARPASMSARATFSPCSTIRSWPPRSAKPRPRRASARAERDRVYSGVRAEEVAIAAQAVQTAEANLVLAQQQNDRAVALAAQELRQPPAARREHGLARQGAGRSRSQARRRRRTPSAGPTAEERALADAKVALAEATVADLQAQLDKTRLVAPVDGTIGIRVAEPGEIIAPGKPVMTLEADGQRWFAFTLREDDLQRH